MALFAAIAAFPHWRCGPTGWRQGGRGGDSNGWLLDQQELGGGCGVVQALPAAAPCQGAMEKLFRLRLYQQEVVSRVLCKQHLDPVKNKKRKEKIGRRLKSQRE